MRVNTQDGRAVVLMQMKNAGKEDRARARVCCALDDLRRAWRNTFFVRHYESPGPADASAGPLATLAPLQW